MTNLPLVSIICTAYNHEAYIKDALDGFVMQKTSFPFEIIVHDDASTDRTADIVRAYETKYPELFANIYQAENQYSKGNGDVGRIVFSAASGKYIALCEGDDYWIDPNKLQKQVDFLEAHAEYSMCVHNALVHNIRDKTQYPFNKKLSKATYATRDLILKSWFTPTASFVYRNNIKMPIWDGVNGDMIIILISSVYGNIYYFPEIMSVYRYYTLCSMSAESTKKQMYCKKYKLLHYFDKHTNYKYYFYTSLKRIKIVMGFFLNLLGK